mmetsp:Transcript_19580/g.24693  ORF Transcript_19580/g.24693 Transcript_19580/m.24693 type:complete len:462 (+) Transcript_19580:92-1477(+)|eukprot:CAMPEP_0203682092 /NCGR_PEP_ID=MMETSP0090-20130426/44661_1 /ASSEMBLY_ACC=CAM_ASM_001088 /TAXON_ID=426623 /ORGANISM="Chaetoceros affinis, Strain CCMP159" /LENGTH=461 /DNA_ID=CAMNT_0050550859 /DNA_START=195 /DNA_END=1580 /DNA_ORIENTATION=+
MAGKAGKKKSKSKTERPPAIDKLLKPAIGVVLAFLGYYFMKGLDTEIPRIDVNDELALREVFFGEGQGQTYAVLCNTPPKEGSTTKPLPISSVFQDAMDELSSSKGSNNNSIVNFVLMDCTHTLPTSGKTIAQKFSLNLNQRPTIFISSPKLDSGVPKQIPSKHLKTGHMLAKVIRQMVLPHTQKIESTKDLKNKCLNASYCAVLLKGGTPQRFMKDAISNLLQKYGDTDNEKKRVVFASVDSSVLYMMGLEEHIPEFVKDTHRFVVFKKVSGGIKEKDSRLITSMASLDDSTKLSHNSMEDLIKSVMSGKNANIKKLSSLPQVKTRTKKLEEQERAKRQRKANASQKKEQASSSTTGAHSGENDGSKDGRRAERERRREEHRKNNPNYREKTPEEIAEIERKRRQRMAEESEKWNIGAEDAPPEGEPIDEDGYDDLDGGDDYGDEEDNDEEDDEEVMDLD